MHANIQNSLLTHNSGPTHQTHLTAAAAGREKRDHCRHSTNCSNSGGLQIQQQTFPGTLPAHPSQLLDPPPQPRCEGRGGDASICSTQGCPCRSAQVYCPRKWCHMGNVLRFYSSAQPNAFVHCCMSHLSANGTAVLVLLSLLLFVVHTRSCCCNSALHLGPAAHVRPPRCPLPSATHLFAVCAAVRQDTGSCCCHSPLH
jgi:hypothetical protein